MIELKLYTPEMHDNWNRHIDNSKNATFMHKREYMDYHSDRFHDYSLIAYNKGKIMAVMPANRKGNALYSHQGLTFGGWLTPIKHFDVTNMLDIFDAMKAFLPSIGISELIYKPSPHIYHSYPAEEDLYAIFRSNGTLIETNVSTTIPLDNAIRFNENSRRAANTALQNGITITETEDFTPFWKILTQLLNEKYGVNPVHSIEEITLLKSRFPKDIRLFIASADNRILGGTLIYDTPCVAHAQYISSTAEGRDKGVLPFLFKHLIENEFKHRKFFDFGISNEDHGQYLNKGLVMQKTGMGGRAIVHNTYRIKF